MRVWWRVVQVGEDGEDGVMKVEVWGGLILERFVVTSKVAGRTPKQLGGNLLSLTTSRPDRHVGLTFSTTNSHSCHSLPSHLLNIQQNSFPDSLLVWRSSSIAISSRPHRSPTQAPWAGDEPTRHGKRYSFLLPFFIMISYKDPSLPWSRCA